VTPRHQQALALARAGIPVFPCLPGSKFPAVAGAYQAASVDVGQIDQWWSQADYNVAISPHAAGYAVADVDPGGEAAWVALLAEHGEPPATYTVETPRGGLHLYYAGALPSTVGKLGPRIDTRGEGGYVLVPPSIVDGKPYRVLHDTDIAALPSWIAPLLARQHQRTRAASKELDRPADVARAEGVVRAAVERGDVAIAGCGGNSRTYRLAAELLSLGCSRETAERLLLEQWNEHCRPPWSPDELVVIVGNAASYGQDAAGAWSVEPAAESFGQTAAFREALKMSQPARSRYHLWSAADFDNEPEPSWVVPGLLPEGANILWLGPSQSFKSFLLLDVMLSVATGRPTFGVQPLQGKVLYGAIEDLSNIGKVRRRAWQAAHEHTADPLDNFRAGRVPLLGWGAEFDDWCAQIKAWVGTETLRLLAIDTAGKTLGALNENAAENVRQFGAMCDALREQFGCTVVAVHHTGKDDGRGARGSSAWDADFDSRIETRRPSMEALTVEVRVRKHKNAADGQRWHFEGKHIGGSLVFFPSEAPDPGADDPFAPAKIARVLADYRNTGGTGRLGTAELWTRMSGQVGDEKNVKMLERLGHLPKLRAYCTEEDGTLWWFLPDNQGD
jgi:hypothetical protein